jgi:hypothetical protein
MIANKIPIPIIAILVGWSPTTMWEMARGTVTSTSTRCGSTSKGYPATWILRSPVKSPVSRSFPGQRQFAKLS